VCAAAARCILADMFSRFGLRLRMAASYVLVSAAAVVLVEVIVLAAALPQIRAAHSEAQQAQQRAAAAEADTLSAKLSGLASRIAETVGKSADRVAEDKPGSSDEALLAAAAVGNLDDTRPGGAPPDALTQPEDEQLQAVATTDGKVVAVWPEKFDKPTLPAEAVDVSPHDGRTQFDGQPALWVTAPILLEDQAGNRRVLGFVYSVLPSHKIEPKPDKRAGGTFQLFTDPKVGPLLLTGGIVLVLLLPLGALFGLLSTRRLIRRIRRLGEGTGEMAGGDLTARVRVSGGDEVGRLEEAFNTMAQRLEAAVETQRRAAGSEAQRAERTRIARELHDAISQDLFSVSLIASGLRKALPPETELHFQAASMETMLIRTMREMQAMLLELRPIALEEAGLASALGDLCQAYEARLGIAVSTRIEDPLPLESPIEHAVFRVVQETLGNAARHGQPSAVDLRVAEEDGHVAVIVRDDGHGFDATSANGRHGMGLQLMRERVQELGGTMDIVSAPEQGTTITVLLPARSPLNR
jgi:signal transduction histidine kinase